MKDKMRGINLPDFKTFYISTVIQTIWYCQKQTQRPMKQNRGRNRPTQICPDNY